MDITELSLFSICGANKPILTRWPVVTTMFSNMVLFLGKFALSPLQIRLSLPQLFQLRIMARRLHRILKGVRVKRVGRSKGVFVITWANKARDKTADK